MSMFICPYQCCNELLDGHTTTLSRVFAGHCWGETTYVLVLYPYGRTLPLSAPALAISLMLTYNTNFGNRIEQIPMYDSRTVLYIANSYIRDFPRWQTTRYPMLQLYALAKIMCTTRTRNLLTSKSNRG